MRTGIRTRLMASTVLPLALMGAVSLYTAGNAISLASYLERLFGKNALIAGLDADLEGALSRLAVYLSTKSSDSLREYIHHAQALGARSQALETRILADEASRLERDAHGLLSRFLTHGEEAIAFKRASRASAYYESWAQAEAAAASAHWTLSLLDGLITKRRIAALSGFATRIIAVQRWNLVLLGLMASLGLAIVLHFDLKLTEPIIHLSASAARIARGDFGGPGIPVESEDEIGTLARGFNIMRGSIERQIGELRNKAEVEASLMEQRLRNLEMANLLKHAELSSLQARIQPHFLFNTLNAGIQLATIESAERTGEFLEHLAAMMRYSTRGLDQPASLKEEFSNVESYAYLMGIRFPLRFAFELSLDPEVEGLPIPKLCIQPLVENSVQHGFPDGDGPFHIRVRAFKTPSGAIVEVEDDGAGFPPGRARSILEAAAAEQAMGASPGHGLGSVVRRLAIFTGRQRAVELDDVPGGGALVRIRLEGEGA